MVKSDARTLTAEQKQSILAISKQKNNNIGLQVEKLQNQTLKRQYTYSQAEKLFIQNLQMVGL